MILFHTAAYEYMQPLWPRELERGEVQRDHYPDGERYLRIATPVRGRDVALIGGTVDDSATLELFDLGCSLVRGGAMTLTIVIPYFGYSTMERAVKPGEVVTGKTRAQLLSAIPLASSGNRVVLFDLHSEGLPYYFDSHVVAQHVYGKPVILGAMRELAGGGDFVIGSTDAGRAKWVESLANDAGVSAAFVYKRRLSGEKTQVSGINAAVAGKTVVIYDDMIRTGGSLIEAAKAYRDAGATRLFALTSHGLFPGESIRRLLDCGLFESIACTNSHPNALRAQQQSGGRLRVYAVNDLLSRSLTDDG